MNSQDVEKRTCHFSCSNKKYDSFTTGETQSETNIIRTRNETTRDGIRRVFENFGEKSEKTNLFRKKSTLLFYIYTFKDYRIQELLGTDITADIQSYFLEYKIIRILEYPACGSTPPRILYVNVFCFVYDARPRVHRTAVWVSHSTWLDGSPSTLWPLSL